MATTLDITALVHLVANYNNSVDLGTELYPLSHRVSVPFTDGLGDDQATELFDDSRSVTTTGETLDLQALTGRYGTVVFTDIAGLYIRNTSAKGSGNLLVGAAAANIWAGLFAADSDILVLPPQAFVLWCNPIDANNVDATNKDLFFDASTGSVGYDIIVWGRTS